MIFEEKETGRRLGALNLHEIIAQQSKQWRTDKSRHASVNPQLVSATPQTNYVSFSAEATPDELLIYVWVEKFHISFVCSCEWCVDFFLKLQSFVMQSFFVLASVIDRLEFISKLWGFRLFSRLSVSELNAVENSLEVWTIQKLLGSRLVKTSPRKTKQSFWVRLQLSNHSIRSNKKTELRKALARCVNS